MPVKQQIDVNKMIQVATQAAQAAGRYLLDNVASASRVNEELDHDVKLQADIESEKTIIAALKKSSDFSILSEECGLIPGKDTSYQWIIDPVDGTYNYLRQIPLCCVSVGLWRGNEPVLGVIYDFNRDEMYSGIMNEKAWLNGRRIHVTDIKLKKRALSCSGLPNHMDFSDKALKDLIEQMRTYQKVRFLGSAALMMAYVACGRADHYYEENIMWWDVAAGIPIVTGAGGSYQIIETGQENCFHVTVSNGVVQ